MKNILFVIILNLLLNMIVRSKKLNICYSFFNLVLTATLVVYFGTQLTLENTNIIPNESINKETAYMYPFILSISIFSFYFMIKNLGKKKDTVIPMIFYFSIIINLCYLFKDNEKIVCLLLISYLLFNINTPNKYLDYKLYIDNIIAILLCVASIQLVQVDSFNTALILLVGLFIFDIFWVFGSKQVFSESVMETVATNVNAPVMLKFTTNTKRGHIILGLGDIILPAIFIKFLLNKSNVNSCYYVLSIITYAIGLILTLIANSLSKKGQPALLYLVPSIVIPTIILAKYNGDYNKL